MTDTPTDTSTEAAPAAAAAKAPHAAPKKGRRPMPTRQAAAGAQPVLEKLFELYPKLFGARFLPLKLGIYEDLLARHPDVLKAEDLKVAIGLHARSTRYLESMAAGHARHDLDGVAVEPAAPEHVHHAILEVFRRRQARTKDDLRPELVARLVKAIEASGLDREAYTACVRVNNEAANALLDEAFAELGARNAKREALQRAFEASGKTVAEFAEMYGLNPAEVKKTLSPAPRTTASQGS